MYQLLCLCYLGPSMVCVLYLMQRLQCPNDQKPVFKAIHPKHLKWAKVEGNDQVTICFPIT